jgi:nucleoside-diphosphate-sugar epimerase
VLVSGGSGFAGSHVCEQLVDAHAPARVRAPQEPPAHPPAVDLGCADVGDEAAIDAELAGVDAVCYRAATIGLGVEFADIDACAATNNVGAAPLLRALWRQAFQGRMVLASSTVDQWKGLARCPFHWSVHPRPRHPASLDAGWLEPGCPVPGGIAFSGARNITTGAPHTVAEMADALAVAFGPGTPRPLIMSEWRAGNVRHSVASLRRAAAVLGFVADIGFINGMAEFACAPMRERATP